MRKTTTILLLLTCFDLLGQSFDKTIDNSINNIVLADSLSVLKIIGPDIKNRDLDNDEVVVSNSDRSQTLVMIFHPGDSPYEFREFRVSYSKDDLQPDYKLDTSFFVSGKGIKLGMNKKQLIKILGEPDKIINERNSTILRYEIDDILYFGRYDFKDGRLIQFWFGQSYP